jgi:hypothetical protein
MGEPQGFTRTNVSLPRALKARMDAVKSPVNWSAVAAQAFEAKLLELESTKEVKGMDDVIARLKAAAELEGNEEYQDGFKAGQEWAKKVARPKELKRIAKHIAEYTIDLVAGWWWDVDSPAWSAPFGAVDYFVFAAWPQRYDDRDAPKEFWEQALGDDAHRIDDADFFRGFGEGAVEIWEQVKDEL